MNDAQKLVVDASIIVKWFVEEESSEASQIIRDKYIKGEIDIIAPQLILFETLNALRYKELFTEPEIKEISEALDAYSLNLYSLRGEYAEKTVEVAFTNNVTIYDSSYISLALLENTRLYTADQKLIESLGEDHQKIVKNIKELKE